MFINNQEGLNAGRVLLIVRFAFEHYAETFSSIKHLKDSTGVAGYQKLIMKHNACDRRVMSWQDANLITLKIPPSKCSV
jgi:hypothetical protein